MNEVVEELAQAFEELGNACEADMIRLLPLPPVQSVTILAQAWKMAQKELAIFRLFQSRLPKGQLVPGLIGWQRAEDLARNAYNRACREIFNGSE